MDDGIYLASNIREQWIPDGIKRPHHKKQLAETNWGILALTPEVRTFVSDLHVVCQCLLIPGDWDHGSLSGIITEHIITYGLSVRDSLTLSSLESPVLCVQRILPGRGGALIEPQEVLLPALPVSAETLLPLLGLQLLRKPQMENPFCDMFGDK